MAKQLNTTNLKKIGLLATDDTLYARLFENALNEYNIHTIHPSKNGQKELMEMIYKCIKADVDKYDTSSIKDELSKMRDKGAEIFYYCCTCRMYLWYSC